MFWINRGSRPRTCDLVAYHYRISIALRANRIQTWKQNLKGFVGVGFAVADQTPGVSAAICSQGGLEAAGLGYR